MRKLTACIATAGLIIHGALNPTPAQASGLEEAKAAVRLGLARTGLTRVADEAAPEDDAADASEALDTGEMLITDTGQIVSDPESADSEGAPYAGETNPEDITESEDFIEGATAVATASVEVTFHPLITAVGPQDMQLFVSDANGTELGGANFEASGDNTYTARIEGIGPGEVTLTVTAPGYAPYTQQLELGAGVRAIGHLTDSLNVDIDTEALGWGMLAKGDFTADGSVNADDAAALAQAIATGSTNTTFDFNCDGAVNLLDVHYFATTLAEDGTAAQRDMVFERQTSADGMIAKVDAGTEVTSGAVEDVLKADTPGVTLAPASGDISADNPVTLSIAAGDAEMEGLVIAPPAQSDNAIQGGTVQVETTDGELITAVIGDTASGASYRGAGTFHTAAFRASKSRAASTVKATIDINGNVVVDFGQRVAVKKITITVTQTTSNKLADIAQVQFFDDMASRIPAPELNIPGNVVGTPGSKQFSLAWDAQTNVTGYEVEISCGGTTDTVAVNVNSLALESFAGGKIKNGTGYTVRVRSVNGDWRSPWSEAIVVTPMADKAPDAPENVSVEGAIGALKLSWKDMEDTDSYTLYYREKGTDQYQFVENIGTNGYTLTNLKFQTAYEVYLTGTNAMGTSGPSRSYEGETLSAEIKVPWYNLINRSVQGENMASHIVSATGNVNQGGQIVDASQIVDGRYDTFWSCNQNGAVTVTFDAEYEIDALGYTACLNEGYGTSHHNISVAITDEAGNTVTYSNKNGLLTTSGIPGARNSLMLTFPSTKAKTVTFTLNRYYTDPMSVSELAFYQTAPVVADIDALWADEAQTVLQESVTQETIDTLRERLDERDMEAGPEGELHPRRDLLTLRLDAAEAVLNNESLRAPIAIDPTVSTNNDSLGFGGLNDWQPLGVVAKENEKLLIYVGAENKTIGTNSDLDLVATQYHAESGKWQKTVQRLKVGVNEVTVPNISSTTGERGGSLYVSYRSTNTANNYSVRVMGGQDIAVLDLHGIDDAAERLVRTTAYVQALEEQVAALEASHAEHEHTGSYDARNCIGNSTEIVLDQIMYSVPASQILNGAGNGSTEERAAKLLASLDSADDMMHLFYQHKGLAPAGSYNTGTYGNNNLPTSRQNIRYMQMFAGAFMYAGGLHIGIEWPETAGLASSPGVVLDETGKYVSGRHFGWGISHEIGHEINQGSYAIAETTNNYFAALTMSQNSNATVRWDYEDVWDKVTSGTKGAASNVFTQLALYWQLHMAYDNGYNYQTYDSYDEQFNNLFFARVDSYSRNPGKAPAPGGVTLALEGGSSPQNLMRLSCAAAKKNLLPFFEAWGFTPDEATIAYANQFEKETRPIQYLDDDAQLYRIEGGASVAASRSVTAEVHHEDNSTQVTLNLSCGDATGMLGFEIKRNGAPVGFVPVESDGTAVFTDTIATVNNRVFTYEVTGVDNLLATTETVTLDAMKISHDGSLAKDGWTASTNLVSADDATEGDDHDPCEPAASEAIERAVDNDTDTVYAGSLPKGSDEQAQVTLSFNEVLTVTGIKYRAGNENAIGAYKVEVSTNGSTWNEVKAGSFALEDGATTVYFNKEGDDRLQTYDAAYLRLTATDQASVSIAELDVLGVTGDDVELVTGGIGYLKEDLKVSDDEGGTVPAGSLVFTGSYKGNPAYNVVKLYDEKGNLIGGSQIIFAEVPEQGELGNVSDGSWLYYIEPDDLPATLPTAVRAELYRVDDAQTLEGERLVAETLPVEVPAELPQITIKGGGGSDAAKNASITVSASEGSR